MGHSWFDQVAVKANCVAPILSQTGDPALLYWENGLATLRVFECSACSGCAIDALKRWLGITGRIGSKLRANLVPQADQLAC
ncbi:MAG: hypothetical protein SH859_15160 [Hyphomicrobium aestuarii]|nr:hypothetical protein [Hyphomicrobium aestuarii]